MEYERAELDGYNLDASIKVIFPGREPGQVFELQVDRIWLIALVSCGGGGACLGYALEFGGNYSTTGVGQALRHATLPWQPLTSAAPITYVDGAGFPSMYPELAYRCVDELHLDNAAAHLSLSSLATQTLMYGIVPVFGQRAAPNRRPRIEGFFGILQQVALKKWVDLGVIPYDVLKHAVDALVAAFNASRAPGGSRSRLQTMRDCVSSGNCTYQRVPVTQREKLEKYDIADIAKIGTDHGSLVLRWIGARYRGRALYKRLKNDSVLIRASSENPVEILISCMRTGEVLGTLDIEAPWNRPHHLQVRRWLTNDSSLKKFTEAGAMMVLNLQDFASSPGGNANSKRRKARVAAGLSQPQNDAASRADINLRGVSSEPLCSEDLGPQTFVDNKTKKNEVSGKTRKKRTQDPSRALTQRLLEKIRSL